MRKFYFVAFALLMCSLSQLSFAQSTTFTFNGTVGLGSSGIGGTPQAYTVPVGVTQIGIDMTGGCGGWPCCSWSTSGGPTASGGRVQCTMNVTPGTTLYIYVGGAGCNNLNSGTQSPGGWPNGGIGGAVGSSFCGGGGGESDIRTSTSGYSASNVLVVAGAGGGGGDFGPVGGPGGGATGGTGQAYSCLCVTGGTCGGGQTGPSCTTGSALGGNGVGGTSLSYSDGGGGGGWWGGNCGNGDCAGGGGSSYPATASGAITAITHTQGYTGSSCNGYVAITVLCTSAGAIVGAAPVCPGSTITLTNPTGAGGTWVSSNPAIGSINSSTGVFTGVSAGTTTVTYLEPNPCGGASATASITVLPLPSAISGTASACVGNTTTLSDAGVGTWVSSNPSVASVSSGLVTGVSAGTAVISYTLTTGCAPATTTVTIYATPAGIGGTPSVCAAGGTSTLTDALSGGSWTSSAPATASIGVGSGLLTGLIAGTCNITYTSANGCIVSIPITVNPLPAAIGGTTSVCVGSTTALTDGTGGGTWLSSNTAQASIGAGTGIATGVSAGTPTITYTLALSGCRVTAPLVVNPLPAAIGGGTNMCVGGALALSDAGGGTWVSSNISAATINTFTGALTGVGPGTTTVTYTLTTGCSVTTSVLVNPLPTAYTLTGGGSYCAGGLGVHIGVSYASTGVNYTLLLSGSPVSLPVAGSNSGLDFGTFTTPGIYTVVGTNAVTGCSSNMTGSITVTINPLPNMHNITGGGGYCVGGAGSPVGTDGSDVGINYQLFNGASPVGPVVAGTGAPLSFGSYTAVGTYTVIATNPATGCSQVMGSSAIITITAAPAPYTLTGGGSFCAGGAGVPVGLSNSDAGTIYQVFHGTTPTGSPVASSGGPINFGLFTAAGIYTVTGTNISGCAGSMTGSVTIVVNPLPAVNTVTGGGAYCAGGTGEHVGLSFSTPGINYSLMFGTGTVTTVGGSGSGLDFGAQTVAGVYTVVAVNAATGCSASMFGAAIITVNPIPDGAYTVMGGGSYCAGGTGSDITISGTDGGVNYQLYDGTMAVGLPIGGTGAAANFGFFTGSGTYTVKGTNAVTGCSSPMTGSAVISINPLPAIHTVTGGGSYCAGGTGVAIMVNGSNTGVDYELLQSGSIVTTLSGTGSPLNFGLRVLPGVYTVTATDSITGCMRTMLGSATISVNPLPVIDTVTGGGSLCTGGAGYHIGLNSSTAGTSYQLYNGGITVGAPLSGAGTTVDFGVKTAAGTYTVTATNVLTGCTSNMWGNAIINVSALPNAYVLTGGGNYCAGGAGLDVNLINSDLNVNYQLYRDGVAVGMPVAGVSGTLSFGLDTFGNYTAKGTDATSGCTANMLATVSVNTVTPAVYTVTGGGHYCTGGTGVLVNLSGSVAGVSYQLVSSGSPVGAAIAGTGSPISYGLITGAGSYTVQATDTLLGCVGNMAGSATVVVNSLPVAETVTGGGSFCAGGGGQHVGLLNSVTGVTYQLYNGGMITGSPVSGSTGSTLDFGLQTTAGTFTASATTTLTGCGNLMAGSAVITVLPAPTPYALTVDNSGNYCAGDTGAHIGLINSQTGVNYQLFHAGVIVGGSVAGHTGSAITLGLESLPGIYTVTAVNAGSSCTSNMPGSVTLSIVPLPTVHTVTGGGGFCPGGTGVPVGLNSSDAGISYQLYNGTSALGTVYGTGTSISFGLQSTPGVYTVIGNSDITPCANTMLGNANVHYDSILTPTVTLQALPGNGAHITAVDSIRALVTNGGADPTYQWYVDGALVTGATGATLSGQAFFGGDSVSCVVTASGPCGGNASAKSIIVMLGGVSVKQVNATNAEIALIPNPNNGTFRLKGSLGTATNELLTVEVTNMLGQVVYTGRIQAANGSIDQQISLSNMANGMYLLNLGSGTERSVFHFVIEQ